MKPTRHVGNHALTILTSLLLSLVATVLAEPEMVVNGCGNPQKGLHLIIPDGIFHEVCNAHDKCFYSTTETQASCNDIFREALTATCRNTFSHSEERTKACLEDVKVYFAAVEYYGEAFYDRCNSQETCYQLLEDLLIATGVLELEFVSAEHLPFNEFEVCFTVHNISPFNTYYSLALYPASERSPGELRGDDTQVAWLPTTGKRLFLRAGGKEKRCLTTAGFFGIARTAGQLGDRYRVELWSESERPDLFGNLLDALEGDIH